MGLNLGRSYGVYAGNVLMGPGDYLLGSAGTYTALTAGTQANSPGLNTGLCMVASGASNSAVVLPPSAPGMEIVVILTTAANTCKVFPSPGDAINALGANNAITMAAVTSTTYCCGVAGQWFTLPRVPS